MQARLLARRTFDQIALVSGLTAGTIESYEGLFFNVRDRLDARDWIVARAIGTTTSEDSTLDRGALLKSFAYFGGPDVLRSVAPYVLGEQDPFGPPLDLTTPQGRSEQVARLAVAIHLLPHDATSVTKLLRINTLVLDLGTKSARRASNGTAAGSEPRQTARRTAARGTLGSGRTREMYLARRRTRPPPGRLRKRVNVGEQFHHETGSRPSRVSGP